MALAGAMALTGCEDAGQPIEKPTGLSREARTAAFAERPTLMFRAAESACSGPGERFVRPAPGVAQCQLLMRPETTAAVILNFDGDIQDLPRLVISLAETRQGEGWIVTGCAFLRVPTKEGGIRRVIQSDPRIRAKIDEILARMGGTPVAATPGPLAERCYSL